MGSNVETTLSSREEVSSQSELEEAWLRLKESGEYRIVLAPGTYRVPRLSIPPCHLTLSGRDVILTGQDTQDALTLRAGGQLTLLGLGLIGGRSSVLVALPGEGALGRVRIAGCRVQARDGGTAHGIVTNGSDLVVEHSSFHGFTHSAITARNSGWVECCSVRFQSCAAGVNAERCAALRVEECVFQDSPRQVESIH